LLATFADRRSALRDMVGARNQLTAGGGASASGCVGVPDGTPSARSLAMLGTQAVCARDAAGHVLAWHVMPVAAAALIGAAIGRRILRPTSPGSMR
jgi:uncharacterized membrane protein YfcA